MNTHEKNNEMKDRLSMNYATNRIETLNSDAVKKS